jgi:hypothetical protein
LTITPSLAHLAEDLRLLRLSLNDLLWSRWGTLLTPGMLAAYTAPNLFEEGTTVAVQEKMPPAGLLPQTEGWGVAVLEGGAFLDDFSKAFLLGWASWHLYTDAVILRMRRGATQPAHIQIVFEEANKILSGLDSGGSEDESGQSTAEQFANMWRDSREYGIWLHLITQSPSLIPPGILSSCNNIFVAQLKHPKDRDLPSPPSIAAKRGLSTRRGADFWRLCPWRAVWPNWATASSVRHAYGCVVAASLHVCHNR